MKQNGTITIQFVFRLRNQGDSSLHFHLTAWSRSLSLCRQWQKNSPRSLSAPKCGFITSNDFSTRQSLHWPEVGLNGLALVTRAQLMVKSVSSTIPLSLRLQMYLERQVRPRWLGFLKSCLWLPWRTFHSGSVTPKYVWSGTFSSSGASSAAFTLTVAW